MSAPTISVVLPVRNAAATIGRAARSILDSTHRELELIIIDDGSTDDTAEVIRQIDDPRLRLIQQEPGGVYAAANRGTTEARAPVIARMDADDLPIPNGSRNNSTSSGSRTSTWWDAGFGSSTRLAKR